MDAFRIGGSILRLPEAERQLCTEHGGCRADLGGGLCHPDDAVQPVVIRERESVQPKARRLLRQRLRHARPVEEAEARVGVQLGVWHSCRASGSRGIRVFDIRRRSVRLALERPGRAVTAVCADRRRRAWP